MDYEWDPSKAAITWAERRISFKSVRSFAWQTALEWRDERNPYEEVRTAAIGLIGVRLHVLIYTRRGRKCRVISLRKASMEEALRYAEFAQDLE